MASKSESVGCPTCGGKELERGNEVQVWECGTLNQDGDFDPDESKDPVIEWETQNPLRRFCCTSCGTIFNIDFPRGKMIVVVEFDPGVYDAKAAQS